LCEETGALRDIPQALSSGLHNITVYANDTFGNIGTSETVSFTIAEPESFPTGPVVAASAASVAVACVGILLYLRKRKGASRPFKPISIVKLT
jgi:hypothetical protein